MKKENIIFFGLLLSSFLISGCGYSELDTINHSRGADYSQGYGDGCDTAEYRLENNSTDFIKKDQQRYTKTPQYKSGWDSGYKECYFRKSRVMRLGGRG